MRLTNDMLKIGVLALALMLLAFPAGADTVSFEELEKTAQAPEAISRLASAYETENRLQEAAWTWRRAGDKARAQTLVDKVKHELQHGEVVSRVAVGAPTSHAELITFASGMQAIWKKYDPGLIYSHFAREVLAYGVDEVLGLDLVPVTVTRTLEGQRGSLQYFIKDARRGSIAPSYPNHARPYTQGYETLWLLDYLIANKDRHGSNHLFRPGNHLVAIDNSMIFWPGDMHWQHHPGVPPTHQPVDASLFPQGELLDKVKSLTAAAILGAVGPIVPRVVIDGILARRDEILDLMRQHDSSSGCADELAAQGIRIVEATYGGNCGVLPGNLTAAMERFCRGLRICLFNVFVPGDPAHGCAKEFKVRWTCPGDSKVHEKTRPAEAGGKIVRIECP